MTMLLFQMQQVVWKFQLVFTHILHGQIHIFILHLSVPQQLNQELKLLINH